MKYALIIIVLVCAYFALSDDKHAMSTCEQHSSHDECFYALNH